MGWHLYGTLRFFRAAAESLRRALLPSRLPGGAAIPPLKAAMAPSIRKPGVDLQPGGGAMLCNCRLFLFAALIAMSWEGQAQISE